MNSLGSELQEISDDIQSVFNTHLSKIINGVIDDYGLHQYQKEIYKKYISFDCNSPKYEKKKKNNICKSEQCLAKKANGSQCSRRKKFDHNFCGSHIKSLPYGMVDNYTEIGSNSSDNIDNNYIETWVDPILGSGYLVDKNNIVYTNNIDDPQIVGIKQDGKILPVSEMSEEEISQIST